MNILLINHYAGSLKHGMEYRPFYFAREWVRAGHHVLVVAASFSHKRLINPSFHGKMLQEEWEGVQYLWIKTPPYRGNGLGRICNMAVFIFRLWSTCSRSIKAFQPNLVIASSTYTWDNWVAARYAKILNAKYVFEVHDLWPLTPMELTGMSPMHPFIWSLQLAENFACRRADKVVSLLPATMTYLIAHGMPPERFAYIPNGIVLEEWEQEQIVPHEYMRALQGIKRNVRCLVGYVGWHSAFNSLDILIEAGAEASLGDIGIVCIGEGPQKVRLREKALKLGSHVLFLESVPKIVVPGLLRMFDILYIGWKHSPLYRFGISPNKLFEYMMAGVPILHAVSAANDPVQEAGCGLSIPPEDVSALCKGILKLAALSAEERIALGSRGRDYVKTHHQISLLSQNFLDKI